jgi:hypothetical protein
MTERHQRTEGLARSRGPHLEVRSPKFAKSEVCEKSKIGLLRAVPAEREYK